MKKTIIAVIMVVLVAVLVGVYPLASGMILERTIHNIAERMNSMYAKSAPGYSVQIVNYERGYSTSEIEWKINMNAFMDVYGVESIIFKEHARHDFSGLSSTTSLDDNEWFNSFINEKLQGQNPLHIHTDYSLFGGAESTVIFEAFSVEIEGEQASVKPGEFVISTDRTLINYKTSGEWQGMTVGDKMSVEEVSVASDLKMITDFVWDGDIAFEVKNINAEGEKGKLALANMKLQYLLDADIDANTMGGDVLFSASSFQGDERKIDDISVRFAIKKMDLDAYEEFMKMYTEMASNIMQNIEKNSQSGETNNDILKLEMQKYGFQIMGSLEKLLKEGLEINISDLQFKLPEGEVKGDLTLRLLKEMSFMQFAPIVYQPQLILDIFYLKSKFSMPATLVGENPHLLTPVHPGMRTGLFIKDGDKLVHNAETKDGKLLLNGQEVILDLTALGSSQ